MGGGVELPPHVEHGSGNAYANYKCRCEPCRKEQGNRNREYRMRDPERFRAQRRAEYAANRERFQKLNRERVAKRWRLLARYKMMKGCQRCGYREDARALEFHHRNPEEKELTISMSLGHSIERIKREVAKCDVLCSNCHRIVESKKWPISLI